MGILTENAIKAPRFGIVVLQPYYTIRYTESVAQNKLIFQRQTSLSFSRYRPRWRSYNPVSYTHLTLPTIGG